MPFTKYQENVIPEHKYLITSQRELQSEMSRNANSIYTVKNIEILQKRNLKSIANVLETKKKKMVSFIKSQLRKQGIHYQ